MREPVSSRIGPLPELQILLDSGSRIATIYWRNHLDIFLCGETLRHGLCVGRRRRAGLVDKGRPRESARYDMAGSLHRITRERRSPWLCPAPSWGAGLFIAQVGRLDAQ